MRGDGDILYREREETEVEGVRGDEDILYTVIRGASPLMCLLLPLSLCFL